MKKKTVAVLISMHSAQFNVILFQAFIEVPVYLPSTLITW